MIHGVRLKEARGSDAARNQRGDERVFRMWRPALHSMFVEGSASCSRALGLCQALLPNPVLFLSIHCCNDPKAD